VDSSLEAVIPEQDAGTRLDVLLARRLGVSRGYARRLIERERVRIGGRTAAKGTLVRAGESLEVAPFRHPDLGPAPAPELPVAILRQADGLVAVDKPAGRPTHALDCEETHTEQNAVLARFPEMLGVGEGGVRSGVVHRLDTFTSGVLVFALAGDAWRRARRAFDEQRVEKRYLARVHGRLASEIDCELRLEQRGDHVRVVARGGRVTRTLLRPLASFGETSLVEARPRTGHRHQIRAALAHLGTPVVGDRVYGSPARIGRHLLHATDLSIEGFAASSPAPPEIAGPDSPGSPPQR
jgi:23S rRNA pseudouridine1911/1915/1917 synthase